jgi:hypothetical protein
METVKYHTGTPTSQVRKMNVGEVIRVKRTPNCFKLQDRSVIGWNTGFPVQTFSFVYYSLSTEDGRGSHNILADASLDKAMNESGIADNPDQLYQITRHPNIMKQGKFKPYPVKVYEIIPAV